MGEKNATIDSAAVRERMLLDFTDLIRIDSPSLKERKMADVCREKLASLGMTVYEDKAGEYAGGECGNLIAALPGAAGMPSVALLAHMDTVGPCENKRWVIEDDIVRSAGDTVLGGDDAAGILAAFEIVRRVEEQGIRHGSIVIILTIAEEIGLFGAKHLDHDLIKSATGNGEFPEFCFVFDSGGAIGSVVSKAPSHTDVIIEVSGVAAHAGIEPEKGVNAISALSEAIVNMPLGRLDDETTANIGIINGGLARNVVCGTVTAEGEVRSHNPEKLAARLAEMKSCVVAACEKRGARYEFTEIPSYEAFSLTEDDLVIKLLSAAAKKRGGKINLVPTGGGSDANILNAIGIPAANLPIGMHEIHGVREYTDLRETDETIELVVEAFRALSER